MAESLKTGRVVAVSCRWATAEKRLVDMLSQMWYDLAQDSEMALESAIAERISETYKDLERTVLTAG